MGRKSDYHKKAEHDAAVIESEKEHKEMGKIYIANNYTICYIINATY